MVFGRTVCVPACHCCCRRAKHIEAKACLSSASCGAHHRLWRLANALVAGKVNPRLKHVADALLAPQVATIANYEYGFYWYFYQVRCLGACPPPDTVLARHVRRLRASAT
jgi:hypothetical protein